MYSTSQLSSMFGKSGKSIKQWVERHETYFTEPARGVGVRNRSYSEEDAQVLATINYLVNTGLNHEAIAKQLASGERVDHLDTRMIPVHGAQQIIDASEIRHELEIMRAERDKLSELIEDLKVELSESRGEVKDLLREMAQVQERAARAEAQVEMLKEMIKDKD